MPPSGDGVAMTKRATLAVATIAVLIATPLIARRFGRLLSYPEPVIDKLLDKQSAEN